VVPTYCEFCVDWATLPGYRAFRFDIIITYAERMYAFCQPELSPQTSVVVKFCLFSATEVPVHDKIGQQKFGRTDFLKLF
jgi:hypothetical protein